MPIEGQKYTPEDNEPRKESMFAKSLYTKRVDMDSMGMELAKENELLIHELAEVRSAILDAMAGTQFYKEWLDPSVQEPLEIANLTKAFVALQTEKVKELEGMETRAHEVYAVCLTRSVSINDPIIHYSPFWTERVTMCHYILTSKGKSALTEILNKQENI